jgi:hypothetical protein
MMPTRWIRLRCRHIFTLLALLCAVPASVAAQSSVTLTGRVSETVTLSVAPTFSENNVQVVNSGGNTVQITFAVDDKNDPVIRVPLLVRSNTSFKITANVDSAAVKFQVTDVHPTGSLASPHVLDVNRKPDASQPVLVLTGSRVSLGGTLTSPNNALQITVLIHVQPQSARGLVHLTFVATPGSLAP